MSPSGRSSTFDTDQNPLLDRFLAERPSRVVDLGAGLGKHSGYMLEHGVAVDMVDRVITPAAREIAAQYPGRCRLIESDITTLDMDSESIDAIWSSHCLEHTLDPLEVLREWRRVLKPDGLLCVIVPPFKTQVVGRHVFTGWTVGQLMLTLLRVGFDIRHGAFAKHWYNACAIVRPLANPPTFEPNDEILCAHAQLFPPAIEQEILASKRLNPFGETISCFEGEIQRVNW